MEDGERTGTTITYYASPDIFETTEYNLETITARVREYAFLNKGLEIVVRDERPAAEEVADAVDDGLGARRRRRAARRDPARRRRWHGAGLQVRPRPGRLRRAPQPAQGGREPHDHLLRGRDGPVGGEPHEPRGRDAVEHLLHRVGPHLRQHHQHPRGRHPRGGLPGGADLPGQPLGRGVGPDQEARGPGLGRRHPRGPHRDHLDQAGQPAVRGPDQDQARQHRGQELHPAHRQRAARRLAGAEPGRGPRHRPQVAGRGHRPDRGPQGARPGPRPQGPARRAPACPASSRTASRRTPPSARSSSSRATPPAARRARAATRGSRRSCRSAARS